MKLRHHVSIIVVVVMSAVGCGERESTQTAREGMSDMAEATPKPSADDTNAAQDSGDGFSPYVDEEGGIRLPTGYKQSWTHLGGSHQRPNEVNQLTAAESHIIVHKDTLIERTVSACLPRFVG